MSFIQAITDFLESIFKRSSPEVQKKQQMKKLEIEAKDYIPSIYKNGNLQPNFGEALFTLYKNARPLDNLFSVTVGNNDLPRRHRFEAQLIITGYTREDQEIIESLSYENRKQEVLDEKRNYDLVYIRQRKKMEKVVKELNSDGFKKMDMDIMTLRQFVDFCHYSFTPFLQLFDSNFIPADFGYRPAYHEVPMTKAINLLEDLFFALSGLKITTATADAVLALAQLKNNSELSESERDSYVGNIKKINYVINKILTPEILKVLIKITKMDANYEPPLPDYKGSPRQEFGDMLQSRFNSEEQRIKTEIQEENVSSELFVLFGNMPLENVLGYNADNNKYLQENSDLSFAWILPIKIMKTFVKIFLTENVKNLLNDIVIEGLFNNSTYKTAFSSRVYAVLSVEEMLQKFEESFNSDKKNSISVLQGYVKDSHKNPDFYQKLEMMVKNINAEAHGLLQSVSTALFNLSKDLTDILADAKKPSSEIISNLKVLVMSSRNRDNTALLETQFPKWKDFFEIMKNYVIISEEEIQ